MALAEFNIGILRYDWEDPRVADFLNNLNRVYDIARRAPGYIWHLEDEDMEAAQQDAQGVLGGNPRTASTLSVWQDLHSLEEFTYKTVHKQFFDRRDEWYDPAEQGWSGHRLVLWQVQATQRPTVAEAVARLEHLAQHGPTDHAFDFAYARKAQNAAC